MIVSKDEELVNSLKLAAKDVAGTFDEIRWAMGNVSQTMVTLMEGHEQAHLVSRFLGIKSCEQSYCLRLRPGKYSVVFFLNIVKCLTAFIH